MTVIPKKQLGQHWLSDEKILDEIIDSIGVESGDIVLEIGPGLGTLTERLLKRKAIVHAVEYDETLFKKLQKHYKNHPRLNLYNQDILQFDFSVLPEGCKVVANIPYYITSILIERLCSPGVPLGDIAILVQKEVAERVCAMGGKMSILSVATQLYAECHLGPVVAAYHFTPPPKVDSRVLILRKYKEPLFDVEEKSFFKLVKAGFSEKRKKLKTSLAGGLGINKETAEELIIEAGTSPDKRPEQLTLTDWCALWKMFRSRHLL